MRTDKELLEILLDYFKSYWFLGICSAISSLYEDAMIDNEEHLKLDKIIHKNIKKHNKFNKFIFDKRKLSDKERKPIKGNFF